MTRAVLRTFALSLVAIAAACGGGTSPLTQIVVVVDSDLSAPGELDAIDIDVAGGQGAAQTTHADLSGQPLPRSLGLVHSTGELGPVRVHVQGKSGKTTLVERSAVVWFKQNQTVLLRMPLARSCANAAGRACEPEMTCEAGHCVSSDIATLPAWNGKVTPFDVNDAAVGGGGAGDSAANAGRAGMAGKGSAGKPAAGSGGSSGSGGTAGAGMPDSGTNQPPACTIMMPTAGASFVQGDSVAFLGACTDPDTGTTLTTGLRWDSDGTLLGVTTHPTSSDLSAGQHTIMLCAADPDDASLEGCASIPIMVTALSTVSATIGSLMQGSTTGATFTAGSAIVATGKGTGADPVTLAWNDSLIGTVAGTSSAMLSDPLVGRHRLTLTVTDGKMRTATDTRTFVVLASGQSKLLAPYSVVNQALTAAGSGKVDALAADAMNYYVAADQPTVLYSVPAGDPTLSGPTPNVAVTTISAMRDVHLHASSGHAYVATSTGLQVCSYTVVAGIDSSACTTYQGGMLPSDSITSVLRLNVSGSDRLLLGTGSGLFIPDDVNAPNGTGSKPLSVSLVSLAANTTTLWASGVDTLQSADLSAITSSASWQSVLLGAGPYSFTHVAVGNSESVYLSGAAGLGRYTPSTHAWKLWRAVSNPSSGAAPALISDDVRSFAIARETIANSARDIIWLGTAAGVSRLDSQLESFTTFTTDDGLPSNSVRAVLVLPNGNKLFGTDSGIALYKGQ